MRVVRPVLRWHGGKWRLADWIITHFPPHKVYTEVFGGAASVLMRKPRSYAEVYNDLEGSVVNLFRVLQDKDSAKKLHDLLDKTPFAREEYNLAYEECEDPIDSARRLVVRSFMGFGSNAHNILKKSGFRANSNRSGTTPAHDWAKYPICLQAMTDRLRGVVIENRNAVEIIEQHDGLETLHYVDPPYLKSTRTDTGHDYNFEMTDEDHIQLAEVLKKVSGMVVLSGYHSDLYKRLYRGWECFEKKALADGALDRVEVVWLNSAAVTRKRSLFSVQEQQAPK